MDQKTTIELHVQEITNVVKNNSEIESKKSHNKELISNSLEKSHELNVIKNLDGEESNKMQELIKIISENETLVDTCNYLNKYRMRLLI